MQLQRNLIHTSWKCDTKHDYPQIVDSLLPCPSDCRSSKGLKEHFSWLVLALHAVMWCDDNDLGNNVQPGKKKKIKQ